MKGPGGKGENGLSSTGTATRTQPLSLRVTGRMADGTEFRDQVPVLGFRDYWYPACGVRELSRRRPHRVRLLGDAICLVKSTDKVVALADRCPHRGAPLSAGRCHVEGTVSCPYHGWTFDGAGRCVAALGEGPNSTAALTSTVRTYPTVVLKGIVFVWPGDGPPTKPELDLPPELSDDSVIFHDAVVWKANWRPALENLNDHHVFYVHRNSIQALMQPLRKMSYQGSRAVITGGGVHLSSYSDGTAADRPAQELYPHLGALWPRTNYRRTWAPLFATRPLAWLWRLGDGRSYSSEMVGYHGNDEWDIGPHMPGMQRINGGSGLFTRWCVPVDEHTTNEFYLWATRVHGKKHMAAERVKYEIAHKWLRNRNLGLQDGRILAQVPYDAPERLTAWDVETIGWRRLAILSAQHGGRQHGEIGRI